MEQPGLREFTLGNGLLVSLVTGEPRGGTRVVWIDEGGRADALSKAVIASVDIAEDPLPRFQPPVHVFQLPRHQLLAVQASMDSSGAELRRGLEPLKLEDRVLYVPLFGVGTPTLYHFADDLVGALAEWRPSESVHVFVGAGDEATARELDSWWQKSEVRRGSQGDGVARLQKLLGIPTDGKFGHETEAEVTAFQRAAGLHVDGVVGPATWAELEARLPRTVEAPTLGIPDLSMIATSLAELAHLPEGADAALLFAALCMAEPGFSSVLGRRDALALGLSTYGIPRDSREAPQPKAVRLNPEGTAAQKAGEHLVSLGLTPVQALVAALLTPPRRGGPHSVEPFLRACGTSARQARALVCRETDASTAAGRRLLELLGESKARVSVSGTYANDKPDGPDLLDIAEEVNALADVIAASERHPPLAVGLFGDWGSGKSFFIGKLKRRLDELTDVARRAKAESQPTAYSARVVHVDFNAWQYADGNLWANLVHRIFEQLSRELVGDPLELDKQAGEERKKKLYGRLALAREQLVQTEQAKAAAAQASEAARVREAILAEERNQAARRLTPPSAEEVARDILALPETRGLVERLDAKLDEKAGLDVLAEVRRTRSELGTLWGRFEETLRWFRDRHPYHLLLVSVSVLAPVVIGLVTRNLDQWLEAVGSYPGVTVILGFVSTGLARLGSLQAEAKKILSVAEEAEASIDAELRRKQDQIVERQKAAHQEIAEANLRLLRVEEERRATSLRVTEIQTEIDSISSGSQLREFIRSRSAGEDYRKHLGIVSTIREDFEHLHGHLAAAQQELDKTAPPIERVVLYVDDLDRCPSDRVVEVLQAVHLLLDFPLFVAVVAVDSRWLLKSLAAHYGDQLGDAMDELSLWASTPQNFLEKIFQIPLALRPMNAAGYGDLIHSLLPVHQPAPTAPLAHAATPPLRSPTATPAPSSSSSSSSRSSTSTSTPHTPSFVAPLPTALPTLNPNPAALLVTAAERDFLKRLAALVSTPRSAKRLVNLYWLTRASLREHDLDDFVGADEEPGTFRVHQFLLAIMVSYPSMVDAFLATFDDPTVLRLSDALAKLSSGHGGNNGSESLLRDVPGAESLAWAAFCKKVDAVARELELPAGADAFREPVRRVARFSFRASAAFSTRPDGTGGPASVRLRADVAAPSRPSGVAARR